MRPAAVIAEPRSAQLRFRRSTRPRLLRMVAAGLGATAVGIAVWIVVGHVTGGNDAALPGRLSQTALEREVGVRVTRLAISGGGGLIDLRYQVVDPDKAVDLHNAGSPPAIVDEASGLRLTKLFHGWHGTGRQTAGLTYYVLFMNPKSAIKPGSVVSVQLGSSVLEHVLVE
jgi:hypothetical protein